MEKIIECICPRCGRRHKLKMFWAGRGTPRIYCPFCKRLIRKVDANMAISGPGTKKTGAKLRIA